MDSAKNEQDETNVQQQTYGPAAKSGAPQLGDRVERFKGRTTQEQSRLLLWVGVILSVLLVLLGGAVAFVNEIIYRRNADGISGKGFDEFDNNAYAEAMLKDTIPFVHDWYRRLNTNDKDSPLLPLGLEGKDDDGVWADDVEPDCLEHWFDSLVSVSGNPFQTVPEAIKQVLESMGLSRIPSIRKHLHDFLVSPQEVPMNDTLSALKHSNGMKRLACEAERVYPNKFDALTEHERWYLSDTLHRAVVLDRLTAFLLQDHTTLHYVADIMQNKQLEVFLENPEGIAREAEFIEFRKAQFIGAASTLGRLAKALSENSKMPLAAASLQTGILESVKLDILRGNKDNARVGIALAAAIHTRPTFADHKMVWALGSDWVDGYVAWNAAFLSNWSFGSLRGMLVPSASSTHGLDDGEDFIPAHIISLALGLMQTEKPIRHSLEPEAAKQMDLFYKSMLVVDRDQLASVWGNANLRGLSLPSPSPNTVERMLFTLCDGVCHERSWFGANSYFATTIGDGSYGVYLGFVLWITTVLAGGGLELLFLLSFPHGKKWSPKMESLWRLSQLAFPLLASVTLGLAVRKNYLALLTLVLGLWKFGFPEVITYMTEVLCPPKESDQNVSVQRASDLLNAGGTLLHHSSASLLICMLLTGTVTPDRHVINPILILLMQHWFILVQYWIPSLYAIVGLVLEVIFEWVLFSSVQSIFENHRTAALAANTMLLAHWMYLMAAAAITFPSLLKARPKKSFVEKVSGSSGRGTESVCRTLDSTEPEAMPVDEPESPGSKFQEQAVGNNGLETEPVHRELSSSGSEPGFGQHFQTMFKLQF